MSAKGYAFVVTCFFHAVSVIAFSWFHPETTKEINPANPVNPVGKYF